MHKALGYFWSALVNALVKASRCNSAGCLFLVFMSSVPAVSAQPLNDSFSQAQAITGLFFAVTTSNVDATVEVDEPQAIATTATLWYRWEAPTSLPVNIYTDGSSFDTILAVYTGASISQLVSVAANDDAGGKTTSLAVFDAVAGETYYLQVGGSGSEVGIVNLTFVCGGAFFSNDNYAQARQLSGPSGRVTDTSVNGTLEVGELDATSYYGGHSVWYRWRAPHNGNWAFTSDGSQFDTVMTVCTGDVVASRVQLEDNDDSSAMTRRSLVRFIAVSNTEYYISVDGFDRESGDVVLNWGETPGNDNLGTAESLGKAMGTVTANNVAASREPVEPDGPGQHSVWYQWVAPSTGPWTFNTQLSDFDTWLGVYSGPSVSNLTLVAESDNVGVANHTSSVVVSATNGIAYYVVVDGASVSLSDGSLNYGVGDAVLNWFPFTPQILQASVQSNEFGLSFWTTYGTNYITEKKAALTDEPWDVVTNCIGSGLATQVVDQVNSSTQGFYRVRVE